MSNTDASLPPAREVVAVDPLFDDGPGAMLELARRYGRYRTYAEHEKIDIDIGRGLMQRHDTVLNFLRTGGLRATDEDPLVLAARTTYFREEYAYGDKEAITGIGSFLRSERLADAARAVHGLPLIQPAIAYANLMVPGQELAVHTDVPDFRGVNRKIIPQWLLVVMHHSGLFDTWRLRIATAISYFQDSEHGSLAYWPDGSDGPVRHHQIRANTALVLDTDSVFHGVDRVTDDSAAIIPPVSTESMLEPRGNVWVLLDGDEQLVAEYDWDELRFSVSWKAYCFADEAERVTWLQHSDDLDETQVVDRLVADLVERGLATSDVARDPDLGLLMIDTYIRFPGSPVT